MEARFYNGPNGTRDAEKEREEARKKHQHEQKVRDYMAQLSMESAKKEAEKAGKLSPQIEAMRKSMEEAESKKFDTLMTRAIILAVISVIVLFIMYSGHGSR